MQHGCGPSAGWSQSWQHAESSAAIARWTPMKQTRIGVAAAGSIIPKQASSQMAMEVRNLRMRMSFTNQSGKQAANCREFSSLVISRVETEPDQQNRCGKVSFKPDPSGASGSEKEIP
jgi:hypothetical protein